MTQRMNIFQRTPNVLKKLNGLGMAAAEGIEPTLKELVLTRASQINRCAPCLDMHTKDARAGGESDERLAMLPAYDEAGDMFTERERAALALTEAITELTTTGFVPDQVYDRAAAQFSEDELAHVIALIACINAYNRINVAVRAQGGGYRPGAWS